MTKEPYQVMPEHKPEEYEAIKADIAARGFRSPITEDENGNILDGHTRMKMYEELKAEGVEIARPPRTVVRSLSDDVEKRTMARKENALRRQLTSAQKKKLAQDQLKDTPQWANMRIGKVVGCPRQLVKDAREELEKSGVITYYDRLIDDRGWLTKSRRQARAELAGIAKTKHENKKRREQAANGTRDDRFDRRPPSEAQEETVGEAIEEGMELNSLPPADLSAAQKAHYDVVPYFNELAKLDPKAVAEECKDPNEARERSEEVDGVIKWFQMYRDVLALIGQGRLTMLSGGRQN